ncbi:MAG: beta galactosidase jelly roll domain-containing protein, partial [Acidobacteriota bacterium]|nr:beta galactosidase jelly roll domain-containing protein [Acidobacteriota bacterium]
ITQRTGTLTIAFQTFTVTQAAGNPLPTIASLTPNSVIASSQAFSLTVNGTGFIPGSIVRWNGNNRTTTFIGNTQLRADIAASDIAVAGTVAITVFTPAPGGGLSNALSLTITPANQGGGPFTGGTFFDRDGGVIGTAFLFNPVTPSGTLPYVDVHGPAGWNSNNLLRLSRSQFPGMAAERSMGWIFTQPITGNYSALGSVGGQSYESSTSINAADTLSAPQITNLTATPGQVIFTWTASSAAQSFLVRINPLPFAGTITSEVIVSGNSRTATLSGLSLVSGATYQALVFALSLDVKTPGAIAGQFNISTHSISFTAPPACSYSISPTNQSFSASGGSSSVSVTTTSACGWTASSNASWITLTSGFSGNGNGTVFYSVSSNTSTSQRTGTLTIAGQTYTVTQAGAGGITIMDHRMTGGPIPTQCVAPVAKYNFTPTDAQAYQWTLVSGANIGDVMRWEFVQPNGTIYFQTATSPLTFSGNVCFSASIFIAGSAAASLPGNWQVRVIYNNTLILTENFTIGTTINVTWRRSPVWVGDQSGPRDAAGRAWNNPSFDDSQWAIVVLPDSAPSDSPVPNDRYYRAHFNWDVSSPVRANFSADDGLAIYVNGVLLGSWGGYRQFGCVNGPPVCTINTIVSPQTIPASLLRAGDNVIAVDLWNAGLGFSLNVTLDR